MSKKFKITFGILIGLFYVFILLCLINVIVVKSNKYYMYDFENITIEESMEFVEYFDIEIPEPLQDSPNLGEMTQLFITQSVVNPDFYLAISWDVTHIYGKNISECVNKCLGNEVDLDTNIALLSLFPYSLKNSTVQDENGNWVTEGGAWDDRWSGYNCYAYSITRMEKPSFYDWENLQYQPGNMSGAGTYSNSMSIEDLVDIIEADLETMGYTNISSSTTIPSITNNQTLICVRKGSYDYHFMKYNLQTNAWYHKPSNTAVLKYNHTPTNSINWTNEYSKNGDEYYGAITYDSDIYFIKYDKNKVDLTSSTNQLYRVNIEQGGDTIVELNNTTYNKYFTFYFPVIPSNMTIKLYDFEMELVSTFSKEYNNNYVCLNNGTYYLKFNYDNSNISGRLSVNISYHNHEYTYVQGSNGHISTCYCGYSTVLSHNYDNHYCIYCNSYTATHDYDEDYQWLNYTQHNAVCNCGAVTAQSHVVASNTYALGGNYASCLLCGGQAELGFIQMGINSNQVTKVTLNGSFILPNGVIVLVDEDLEDYLNGTLVFYNKNQIPVTQ